MMNQITFSGLSSRLAPFVLVGGPAHGDTVTVAVDVIVVSIPCMSRGWAVYYKSPYDRFHHVAMSHVPVGFEVQ